MSTLAHDELRSVEVDILLSNDEDRVYDNGEPHSFIEVEGHTVWHAVMKLEMVATKNKVPCKAVYALQEAPRVWNAKLGSTLKIMGFDFGLHNLRCLRVSH